VETSARVKRRGRTGPGTGSPGDELAHYRHEGTGAGAVESAVRAAGSYPTQGGGTRAGARASRAVRRAEAARAAGSRSERRV